jgi:hypothetical protein
VELLPDLTKAQAEIALGVMTRGCHGGYGTAWVPLGDALINSLEMTRVEEATAGGDSFELLLDYANDAVLEFMETDLGTLLERNLQSAYEEAKVVDENKLCLGPPPPRCPHVRTLA